MKLSVTSVMLPRWNLRETFEKLAEHGYEGIELRVRDNPDDPHAEPSYWGYHRSDVSPNNILDRAEEIRSLVRNTGVKVFALAPKASINDHAIIDRLFAGARAIDPDDPPMVRIGATGHDRTRPYLPQFDEARAGYASVVETASKAGIKVLYELHVGSIAVSCSRAAELLRGMDPDHIGAIYDIPNMIRGSIEDSKMGMEVLGSYLAHCHAGNGIPVADKHEPSGDNDRIAFNWSFTDLRQGVADVPQIIGDLQAVGYDGYVSLEEFGPGDDEEKIRAHGAYLRHLIDT